MKQQWLTGCQFSAANEANHTLHLETCVCVSESVYMCSHTHARLDESVLYLGGCMQLQAQAGSPAGGRARSA